MDPIEVEGKTVEEAIAKACDELQVPKEKLSIEVISNGSSGVFGLMGVKKAKILVQVIPDDGENKGAKAKAVLENILRRIDVDAAVELKEEEERVILDIKGDGSGLLIGRRGQTLNALQYLINKIVSKDPLDKRQVIVDTESYRERREQSLIDLARRLSDKAKQKGAPVMTGPLDANDRRIVHLALKDDEGLSTKSKGEGVYRRVVITPKKGYE
jgi:spoIIIJ-associated protein